MPEYTIPVLTKKAFAEQKTIKTRIYGVKNIRKDKMNISEQISKMFKAYMREGAADMCKQFMTDKITYNPDKTKKWLNQHDKVPKRVEEWCEFIDE